MKKILKIILLLLIVISCNTKSEFNSKAWNEKGVDWWMTDIREKMVDDLIESDTLIGLTRIGIINLLGQPDKEGSLRMKYLIRENMHLISTLNIFQCSPSNLMKKKKQ